MGFVNMKCHSIFGGIKPAQLKYLGVPRELMQMIPHKRRVVTVHIQAVLTGMTASFKSSLLWEILGTQTHKPRTGHQF